MKNLKVLPISIASIILAAFLAVSFVVFDASESVSVKAVAGSYAETFAKENDLEYIELNDSENDDVSIPIIDEAKYAKKEMKNNNKNKLSKPKNLKAQTKSVDSISLTWDSVENADRYEIYQATITSDYEKIATTSANDTTAYLVKNLDSNKFYFYSVKATSDDKEIDDSNFSEVVYAITAKENMDFAYNYDGESVDITEYKGLAPDVIVPNTIDGLPVKTVSMKVLNKGIRSVQIPESVTKINSTFKSSRYTKEFYTVMAVMILGYLFAVLSTFIGFKKSKTTEGTFYGIPFVYSGLVTYIAITIWCGVSLFFGLSQLLQVVVAIIIFACALGKLLKKTVARELIEQRGEEVKQQTQFIKMLSVDANTLVSKAKSDKVKTLANEVYEAIRYSDPMSIEALAGAEAQITIKFKEFSDAVIDDDYELSKALEKELLILIEDRNNKCKLLK